MQLSLLEAARSHPLLRRVPEAEIAALQLQRLELPAGRQLFREGEPCRYVYGVLHGRIRVSKAARAGRELCLEIFGPGDVVAVVAAVRNIPLPASAEAIEETALLAVEATSYRALVERHPLLAVRCLQLFGERLQNADESRLSLATDPVDARLARILLRLGEKYGAELDGKIRLTKGFTRHALADLAGTTEESTIRVLTRWRKDGLVADLQGRLVLERPAELRRLAGCVDCDGCDEAAVG